MNPSRHLSRRDFIKISTNGLFAMGGLLGLGGLLRFLNYAPEPAPPVEFELGAASLYPAGSRTVRSDIPAVIYGQDGQVQALSLICTHLGCSLESTEDGEFTCPCHGSHFDANGKVLGGPAARALAILRVEKRDDGTLILFMG